MESMKTSNTKSGKMKIHLNKRENLRTSHLEAYWFNAGEGQSATFCRESTQIYRTLFVSNSRNQQVGIDPSQITAYAHRYETSSKVHMNFTKITRYLTKLCNFVINCLQSVCQLTVVINLKLEMKTAASIGIWNSIKLSTPTDYHETLFSNTDNRIDKH